MRINEPESAVTVTHTREKHDVYALVYTKSSHSAASLKLEIVCIQGDQLDITSLGISIDFLLLLAYIVEIKAAAS